MEKKPYEAPMVKKVRLEVKESVLAVCHTSQSLDPSYLPGGCQLISNHCLDYIP